MKTLAKPWNNDSFYLCEMEWATSCVTLNLHFLDVECWKQDISTISQDSPGKSKMQCVLSSPHKLPTADEVWQGLTIVPLNTDPSGYQSINKPKTSLGDVHSLNSNSAWTEVQSTTIVHFASFQRHKLEHRYIQKGTFANEKNFDFLPLP